MILHELQEQPNTTRGQESGTDPLSLRVDREPLSRCHYLHVFLEGQLVEGYVDRLEYALRLNFQDSTVAVVIDLSAVTGIDSTAIGVLLALKREIERRDVAFVLVGINGRIERVFQCTGCDRIFQCLDSVEAIAGYCEQFV